MTEKPIIFSGPMVKAILEGRKTMTRRILKPQPIWTDGGVIHDAAGGQMDHVEPHWTREPKSPYAVGDRLWVREAWAEAWELDENDQPASEMLNYYRADGEPFARWLDPDTDEWRDGIKWRSPIHMPRWASRITLAVTAVKIERVQDISRDDVIAEGCAEYEGYPVSGMVAGYHQPFAQLWNTIHGPGAWDRNDWVAALTFERVNAGQG